MVAQVPPLKVEIARKVSMEKHLASAGRGNAYAAVGGMHCRAKVRSQDKVKSTRNAIVAVSAMKRSRHCSALTDHEDDEAFIPYPLNESQEEEPE